MKAALEICRNIPLSEFTTFGIGGPAKYFFEAKTTDALVQAVRYCKDNSLRFIVLGKGSNVLFDDKGFDGMVIFNKVDFFEEEAPGRFHVGAGYSFSLLGAQTARKGWSGLEFASGIPGSVGGAVFMNAGANGGETCEALYSVDFIDERGILCVIPREELTFEYRTSPFQKCKGAIAGATFQLAPSDTARKKQIEIITYRKNTQPYGEKSAGCVFRNPQGGHAGKLIEESGLKGAFCGKAQVSDVHANFIINSKGASAEEVLKLIALVQKRVKEHSGIMLESEVRVVPFSEEDQ